MRMAWQVVITTIFFGALAGIGLSGVFYLAWALIMMTGPVGIIVAAALMTGACVLAILMVIENVEDSING